MQPAPDLTLMMMELPAKTAAVRGLSTLWKGQFQGTMAPTCVRWRREGEVEQKVRDNDAVGSSSTRAVVKPAVVVAQA